MSIPLQAGIGKTIRYIGPSLEGNRGKIYSIWPLGAGLSASIKFPRKSRIVPFRYTGLNLLSGYRFCITGIGKESYSLSGVYYSVGTAIFLDRLYDDIVGIKSRMSGTYRRIY